MLLTATSLCAAAAVSRDDAAALVQRETGGRVLAVESADNGGRAAWRVKVLTRSGDVRVVLIDLVADQSF